MSYAADLGAIILPPMPAFYHMPSTIQDIIDQTVGKILDQFDVEHDLSGGGRKEPENALKLRKRKRRVRGGSRIPVR